MLCGKVAMEGHDVDDQVARDDEENNNIHTEEVRDTHTFTIHLGAPVPFCCTWEKRVTV